MKIKTNKKWIILFSILAVLCLIFGFGFYKTTTTTASADTSSTPKYLTYGTTTSGGKTSYGCPSNFKIYMNGTQDGTQGTIYPGTVTDWNHYYIYIEPSAVSNHLSFKLLRNGSVYYTKSISGNGYLGLFSDSLPDGSYEIEYTCQYRPNIFVGYTQFLYTFNFDVDKTEPTYSLTAGGYSISNNSYTNKQIVYTANDAHLSHIRYCKPNGSFSNNYSSSYTVAATNANNGWWSFYAVDTLWAHCSTVSVYLDTIAPVGKVINTNGVAVPNGGYTNSAIRYTATDTGGVSYYQVKYPGSSSWSNYSGGSSIASNYGWYTFRAVDKAGNTSEEYKVYYDAGVPAGTLYGGTTSKASGSYTNASYVKYTATDSHSGIDSCYVRMPNTSYYTKYSGGTQLATEGKYYFYSTDKSGNQSSVVSITLDKTSPTGTLYGGTSALSIGSITNAQYIKFVPYDAIGLSATYVKKPNTNSYVSYTSGTQLTAEGQYSFYSVDKAGNKSIYYNVTLDRHIPAAQLYVDGKPIDNNGYTNGAHIYFECAEKCYVKLPGSTTFKDYISEVEYYKPGKYVFYGVTDAGTSSGYYTIVIDRTIKTLDVNNITEGITNGDVTLTWTDGDPNSYAPIKNVTVNGKPYKKGEQIYTIDTGNYQVHVTDAAGNEWKTEFSSTKRNIVTQTLQKEYYEIYDANGDYHTFASYESAFNFAALREKGYVHTAEWNSSVWDTGMAMDAKDSVNAVNGTFFIYKKSGNPAQEVAYFTEERLNEVIAEYAKEGITDYFYWEKEPAPFADGENMFTYSDTKTILADFVEFGENITCFVDGIEYVGKVYSTEGIHVLTVCDEWGNNCEYVLKVIRSVPEIKYALGEGNKNTASFDRVYYFKDQVEISITDAFDDMAMFSVFNESGKLLGNFNVDESFTIINSGKYTVVAVNHIGKTETFTLVVSRSAPTVQITENTEKKKLEIDIADSEDKESKIETLEILKSIDGGLSWIYLVTDDYGKEINTENLTYAFCTTGNYKVVISDKFRTGIDAVTQIVCYTQPVPEGKLSGVANGGYTNGTVVFEWTDEAEVVLEKDGEIVEYVSGQVLKADGSYILTFTNRDGFIANYSFVIDTIAPELKIEGAKDGESVNCDVKVLYDEDRLVVELFKDGESVRTLNKNTLFTDNGNYRIVATDLALNKSEVSFTIDKFVDYKVNVNNKGLSNCVTITANETVTIELIKNGEKAEYNLGEDITVPAVYAVKLTDELGNTAEFAFTVVEPVVQSFEYNFDDMPGFEKVVIGGEEKRLNYGTLELKEDGVYEVGVVVNGEAYFFTVTVDSTAPVIIIDGVENDGKTNTDVSVDANEEGTVFELVKDGVSLGKYINGTAIKDDGNYTLKATDIAGNFSEVKFTIDKIVDFKTNINEKGLANLVIIEGNEPLTVTLLKDGVEIEYALSDVITEPACYSATVTDELGNKAEVSFVIVQPLVKEFEYNFDEIPNLEKVIVNGEETETDFGTLSIKADGVYDIGLIADGKTYTFTVTIDGTAPTIVINGVEDGGKTKKAVTLTDVSEAAEVKVYLNDSEIEYTLGDKIKEAGHYKVTVTDECGNCTQYSFEITKGLSGGIIALIVICCLVVVGGAVTVVILKKKNVF